jgi:hypothetical protein
MSIRPEGNRHRWHEFRFQPHAISGGQYMDVTQNIALLGRQQKANLAIVYAASDIFLGADA